MTKQIENKNLVASVKLQFMINTKSYFYFYQNHQKTKINSIQFVYLSPYIKSSPTLNSSHNHMKNENTHQTIPQNNTLLIEQSPDKQCPSANPATHVCCNKSCDQIAFICANQSCKCYKQHRKCPHLSIKSILNTIQDKVLPFQHYQQSILNKIDETIDQLSNLKDKIQNQIKQDLSFYGLSIKDQNLLNTIKQQKTTGKQLFKSFNEAVNQDQAHIFKESLQNKFNQLWKTVDTQINKKSSQFFKILDSYKNQKQFIDQKMFKDSKIITEQQSFTNLMKMFGNKQPEGAKLFYRASENNFKADKFHQKCDEIPHTLTICETVNSKIIGGYNPLVWNKSSKFLKDESGSTFIFSLTNNHKFILNKSQDAIYQYSGSGPLFGSNHPDFHLCDSANISAQSWAKINQSYTNENYTADNGDSYLKFTGNPAKTYYFQAKEWEVWELKFNQ